MSLTVDAIAASPASMNVLVTGANGFLGRHLLSRLAGRAHVRVDAVSRRGGTVGTTTIDAVDLTDAIAWEAWLQSKPDFEAVVHLAAEIPAPGRIPDSATLLMRNLESTRNALRAVSNETRGFVYASSAFAYDPGASPVTETSAFAPTTFYHLSKSCGESLVHLSTLQHTCRAASLRIAAPYGLGQNQSTVLWRFLDAARESRDITLLGSGTREQDFIHVDDVVTAIELAIELPVTGAFNIASGASVTMRQLAELAVAVTPGSTSAIRTTGDPDPQDGVRWRFSIDKARSQLGFEPRVTLRRGMSDIAVRLAEAGAP